MQNLKLIDAFQEGDLLYGLSRVRKNIQSELTQLLVQRGARNINVTIDETVKPVEQFIFHAKDYTASPLQHLSTPTREHTQLLLSDQSFYPDSAEHPSSTAKEKHKFVHSCLTAIENSKGKIHFCLDELNLIGVRDPGHAHYSRYTSIELRYIATHYQKLRGKILFYANFERVVAPWEESTQSPEDWLDDFAVAMPQAVADQSQEVFQTPPRRLRPKGGLFTPGTPCHAEKRIKHAAEFRMGSPQ
ncbi:MAG: hypothetical protein M3R00_03780 [Pseudomonadota bacterium]|nr:hypothetical protein [Pseudomonadota bacterium]